MGKDNIYKKSKKGVLWTSLSSIVNGGLGLVTMLFYSLLLTPNLLGQISILTLIYTLAEKLVDFGISESIVVKKDVDKNQLSSIFWINQCIGLLIFVIIFMFSGLIANFYNQPQLIIYIRMLSIIFLTEPLDLVFRALLHRDGRFELLEKVGMIKIVIKTVVVVSILFSNTTPLAYVISMIVGSVVDFAILLYVFIKEDDFPLSFYFNLNEIRSFYNFGVFIIGKTILTYFGRNADEIVIGSVLGVESLGIYHFAKQIMEKSSGLISTVFRKVNITLFSRLRLFPKKLKRTYLNLSMVVAVSFFLFYGLIFLNIPFVTDLIKLKKWNESVFFIQVFSIISMFYIISSGFAPVILLVFEIPHELFWIDIIFTPLRLILLFVAAHFDLQILSITFLILVIAKVIYLQFKANKYLELQFVKYLKLMSIIFINVFISIIISLVIPYIFSNYSDIMIVLLQNFIFLMIYFLLTWLCVPHFFKTIKIEVQLIYNTIKLKC